MKKVTVVGHRGAAGLEPENTLLAFQKAIDLGADAVELDVRLSSDGRVVCMHDDTVDRTTNGTGRPGELTFEELRSLDAGKGEKIPLLEEALELCRDKARVLIELKEDGTEEPSAEAVKQADMSSQVAFLSFQTERLGRLKDIVPEIPRVILCSELPEEIFQDARKYGVQSLSMSFTSLSSEAAALIRQEGLGVITWTPNSNAELEQALTLGPNSITTDFPDRLISLMQTRDS